MEEPVGEHNQVCVSQLCGHDGVCSLNNWGRSSLSVRVETSTGHFAFCNDLGEVRLKQAGKELVELGRSYMSYIWACASDTDAAFAGQITSLDVERNRLKDLDVSKLGQLKSLCCFGNDLWTLNVSGLGELRTLDVRANCLHHLLVVGCRSLQHVDARFNMCLVQSEELLLLQARNADKIDAGAAEII